ncbi:MAG: TraM recognition domain-containing protein [bacterium]|nr:TraM recognition domain-containing protein [bacterium]
MTPYHLRASQIHLTALCLALIDPILTILTGLWLATKLHPIIESWMQHRPLHYLAWAIALYVGSALIASNIMALAVPIARGFGADKDLFSASKPRYLAFWIGIALVGASHIPLAMQWVAKQDQFPDYDGTIVLMTVAAIALSTGVRDIAVAAWNAIIAATANAGVEARNRRRWQSIIGQLALCGGIAQGVFRERNLTNGAPEKGAVLLYPERSANRGTLVVGAPGSSKTRSKIYPDFYWGLRTSQRAGAIVFITKKRATDDFLAIARAFRPADQVHVVGIGAGRATIDITAGMSHESVGDAIKDGLGESHSEFWKQGPSAFVEGFVELIQALHPATIHVPPAVDKDGNVEPGADAYDFELGDTLPTLLDLVALDGRLLDAVFAHALERVAKLELSDWDEATKLRSLLREIKGRVVPLLKRDPKLAEELRQSALPQLQPFGRGAVRRAFCDRHGIDLSLVEQGHVILVEIDEAEHPRAVNTVVRMLFRRVVQMARERTASNRIGTLDPILLVCDEYANYAAAGHVQAWNTIRESNFIATVGLTSLSALAKQIGDQRAADAIVSNFSNKFFFDSDDRLTRDLANELVGKTMVIRRGTSEGTSTTSGTSSTGSLYGGSHRSRGTSQTENTSEQREDALDGSIWRSLQAERESATAIAFVRTDEGTMTDVVTLGVLDPSSGIVTALPEHFGL